MIKLILSEVIEAMGGRVRGDVPMLSIAGISTDSRSVQQGELFFAVAGENFDGHDFVVNASKAGAIGAVIAASKLPAVDAAVRVSHEIVGSPVIVIVDDTTAALNRLASFHRRQSSAQVIAVVGSNGKTTTKSMIDHILAGRFKGRSSPKSFNNHIGVPVTLLSTQIGDEYLVVEIGTNAPGEVAELAAIAQPELAIVTSIGEEHLEGLHDLDGVAAEECSVFEHVAPGGFVAVNADAPQLRGKMPPDGVALASFGRHESADLRITATDYEHPWLSFELNGRFRYRMQVLGNHNATNAAGAVMIAKRMGMDHGEIAARLETFKLPPMRGELLEIGGVTWINDAYNANPASAKVAIETLETLPCNGRRFIVFGEMRELGSRSREMHQRVAEQLAASRIDRILLVGNAIDLMRAHIRPNGVAAPTIESCETIEHAADRLVAEVAEKDIVLLKASRAVGLERVLPAVKSRMEGTKGR